MFSLELFYFEIPNNTYSCMCSSASAQETTGLDTTNLVTNMSNRLCNNANYPRDVLFVAMSVTIFNLFKT